MSEVQATSTTEQAAKPKAEIVAVQMSDGRSVNFAGKRKVNKETLIDEGKIEIDEGSGIVQLQRGAVAVRMDFRNGETRTLELPLSLLARFAGHGGEQKFGDELATTADKPLSEEDMVIAIDDLYAEIAKGKWGKGRAAGGGGVSGASMVIQAILEAVNNRNAAKGLPLKTLDDIKAYVQKRLDAETSKPEGERLTRRALYDSFRAPGTETGVIIERMEKEKAAKNVKVDANAELANV